ncbi:MAG: LCP family protein [Anaerolineales bacterium]|nr:MAG: LCP family protein [Anaerolineales bacterium]
MMRRLNPLPFIRANRRVALIGLVLFIALAAVAIPTAYSWSLYFGSAPTGLFGLPNIAAGTTEQQVDAQDIVQGSPDIVLPPAWDGAERVTILIMGLDYRDWSAGEGPSRTDSMMLLSVDPVSKTAGMLSIPRDLWAVIPGFTPNKINTAYYFGELYKVPGGGPELARRTVEQTIGVPIDYYAQIDFSAFIRFIDLLGGVKIDVPERILIDPLGERAPLHLQPGIQVLPGDLALAYARDRYSGGGDFARAQRQQQIVLGIRDRIMEFNLLPGLVANAPAIYAELSSGIRTNLSLTDAIQLAVLAAQIPRAEIAYGVIGEQDIIYGRSPDDLAILIPVPDRIHALRDSIFTNGALSPLTPGSPAERMAAEAPVIGIQDGSGNSSLAARTQDYLNTLGAQVVQVFSGPASSQTVLVDHTGNPHTLSFLAELMGIPSSRILHEFDPSHAYEVEIRLGSDWANNNSLP